MRLHATSCSLRLSQRGFSLVELMISMVIGLLLLLGISQLIVQQNNTRNELEKESRQIDNGRYATQVLQEDIQLAGYYGTYYPPGNTVYTTPAPCGPGVAVNQGWTSAAAPQVPVAILGYPGSTAAPLPCLDHYQPNTAVLVVHHVGTTTSAKGLAQDVQLLPTQADGISTYLQVSHCPNEMITTPFVIGTTGFNLHEKDCQTPAGIRKYYVRVYYISSCDQCGSDTTPTLKVVENNSTPVALVEGIENMQFDYGLDDDPIGTGDGYPDNWTINPPLTEWVNVMVVRINLLARNNDQSSGYKDTKTYCLTGLPNICGGVQSNWFILPQNDAYKRHLYSEVVRAINPIGRRANP